MKLKIFAIALLIFSVSVFGQVEYSGNDSPFYSPPGFFYDILNFSAKDTAFTRVDVFIQTPFDRIQFVKTGEIFHSEYTLNVAVYDEYKLKIITEKTWTEKVDLKDFKQTHAKNNFNLSFRSFNLKPATYVFKLSLEDIDSKKEYHSEKTVLVRTFNQNTAISDIMLINSKTNSGSSTKLVPNVNRNVANFKDGLPLFFEVFLNQQREVKITYQILDVKNNKIFEESKSENLKKGNNQVFYNINFTNISLGDYKLIISADDEAGTTKIISTKGFYSKWLGVPSSIKDLEHAADQMIYIATGSDIASIKEGKDLEEKLQRFFEFWQKKDPTPGTVENEIFNEYYRRVDFATKNFKNVLEGWRTDMGMVYITLGPPANVERHPFEYDSKPYEIWEYYDINRQFVFVDATGFGEYRLVTPFFGEYQYKFRE